MDDAKSLALEFLASHPLGEANAVREFINTQAARGSPDGVLAASVFQSAIEPREAAFAAKDALLQRFRQWDDEMHPLVVARASVDSEVRKAVDLYLTGLGAETGFGLTRAKMASAEQMLGGNASKTEPRLSIAEVGALLGAPHVTTIAQLSEVVARKERQLEAVLGYPLDMLREIASEAARDDDRFE